MANILQLLSLPTDLNRFLKYLFALRPWSFTISLTPVMLGCCLGYKRLGEFDLIVCLVTCITALCVHSAGNLVNTYYDFRNGVDSNRSDDRTLVDNIITTEDVVNLAGVLYTCGCIGVLCLAVISKARIELLAVVYFVGMTGSFLYTGGLGLKYIALGDLLIFLTFGPLSVQFAYLAQTGYVSLLPILYALPLAVNTETILHANNTRDMEDDKLKGVVTLAILCGKTGSYALFLLTLFVPYVALAYITLYHSIWFVVPLVTVVLALKFERLFRLGHLEKLPQRLAGLNLQLGLLYVFAVFMTPTANLPTPSLNLRELINAYFQAQS